MLSLFTSCACLQSGASNLVASERAALLGALRLPVEKDLKQPVAIKVEHLKAKDDWAFLRGVPQTPSGKAIDYRGTRYAKQISQGFFDDNISALLKKKDGQWTVVTYNIGATDVAWLNWGSKSGAPSAL